MVKQWTINPQTKEWEQLTPEEWKKLKAGFIRTASVEDYVCDFKIDEVDAIKRYTQTEHDEYVALFFIGLYTKMCIYNHSVHRQYQFCLWCRETFYYPDVRAFYAPIYKLRKTVNEISKLIASVRT